MKKVVSYLAILIVSLFAFVNITNAEVINGVDISSGTKVIYLGREGCGYCKLFEPGLKYLSKKYNFSYDFVDTDKLTEDDLKVWIKKLNLNIEPDKFGTPTFAVLENGVVKESNIGFMPEANLFTFLQNNGIIGANEKYEVEFKNIKFISNDDYYNIIDSGKKAIILLSQPTCLTCINAKLYLDELVKELKVDINYYDLEFISEEEYNKFYNSNKYIKEQLDAGTLMTPTFLIIQGDETLAKLTEFSGKEDVKKFINENYDVSSSSNVDVKVIVIVILSILLVVSVVFNVISQLQINKLKK